MLEKHRRNSRSTPRAGDGAVRAWWWSSGCSWCRKLPIDAVPDVTNVQVVVLTEAPGLSAEEMERFVTFPVEMALNGLPELDEMRSVTRSGLSAVTSSSRRAWTSGSRARWSRERLREIEADIPPGFGKPQLAPVSTGLGEIYQFVLESDRHTPMELRALLEWELTPKLRSVPGVIEVNAMGGAAKEYQVVLDPGKLAAHRSDARPGASRRSSATTPTSAAAGSSAAPSRS